jgi:Tol biopolymer transport system component
MSRTATLAAEVVVLLLAATGLPFVSASGDTLASPLLVSVTNSDTQSNGTSGRSSLSRDGTYVAFESSASNLVRSDTNGNADVFVRVLSKERTRRVSVSSAGREVQRPSLNPSISGSGRFVAFESEAGRLVRGDTNHTKDVFVHDRDTHTTSRVSVSSSGSEGFGRAFDASLTARGRYVVFTSSTRDLVRRDTNLADDVFVHDRRTGRTNRVSVSSDGDEADGDSVEASISPGGRYVAFASSASNLVTGDTNATWDIFMHDRKTGITERISVSSSGEETDLGSSWPSISTAAHFVTFTSAATNLVPNDTNAADDVFVRNRSTGLTKRVSIATSGQQSNGSSGWYRQPTQISDGGRFVVFSSIGSNLVSNDTNGNTDVFVRDRRAGTTARVSVKHTGAEVEKYSGFPAISADGRWAAFHSPGKLVWADTNGIADVYRVATS